jgi:hypothetical protein
VTILTKTHNKHMAHILMVGRLGNNAGEIFSRKDEGGWRGRTNKRFSQEAIIMAELCAICSRLFLGGVGRVGDGGRRKETSLQKAEGGGFQEASECGKGWGNLTGV